MSFSFFLVTSWPSIPEDDADNAAHLGHLRDDFRQDVLNALLHLGDGRQLFLRIDQRGQQLLQVGGDRIAAPDRQRRRLEAALACRAGERLLFGFVGEVQVFQPARRVGREEGVAQLVRQLALRLDALEDGLLAISELAELIDPQLNDADDLLVQAARPLLAITGDEGNGVPFVEELDHAFHLDLADLQILCDPR